MGSRPRVVVVGLGPAGPELIDRATLAAIDAIPHRYVRTRRHPAVTVLPDAVSFDSVYESTDTLEAVYASIVDELVGAAAERGEVLYAVPGSPLVAEHTVELLRADERVTVDVLPALSFLDLVWNRLEIDPLAAGVRLVDGRRFAVEAAGERGPLLVAQCDNRLVLSDIKLALDAAPDASLAPAATVTVLQRLGSDDEQMRAVPWAALDRDIEPDHLTTVWIPELAVPVAREVERFAGLVATLRRECPWDREQTHRSLMRHLVEETYEVLDAIERVDPADGTGYDHLEEELGDLLFQVVFHATLAAEQGQFTLADVATSIHDKLHARHPHVFGDVAVQGSGDVVRNWEQIKKEEKGRSSVFDGIPDHLPALLQALKVQKKTATLADQGIDPPPQRPLDDIVERATSHASLEEVGELLFAVSDLARRHDVDPEMALRSFTRQYRALVRSRERS